MCIFGNGVVDIVFFDIERIRYVGVIIIDDDDFSVLGVFGCFYKVMLVNYVDVV